MHSLLNIYRCLCLRLCCSKIHRKLSIFIYHLSISSKWQIALTITYCCSKFQSEGLHISWLKLTGFCMCFRTKKGWQHAKMNHILSIIGWQLDKRLLLNRYILKFYSFQIVYIWQNYKNLTFLLSNWSYHFKICGNHISTIYIYYIVD